MQALVERSPTVTEFENAKEQVRQSMEEFKRPVSGAPTNFERDVLASKKHKKATKAGKKRATVEQLVATSSGFYLDFQHGCYSDGRCRRSKIRGPNLEWIGCDSCEKWFHLGCAVHARHLRQPKKGQQLDEIEFQCYHCQGEDSVDEEENE